MSKGKARLSVRVGDEALHDIDIEVMARNNHGSGTIPWTRSRWIQQAICDKLNHCERSRRTGMRWVIQHDDNGSMTLLKVTGKARKDGEIRIGSCIPELVEDPPNPIPDKALDDDECPW